MSRPTQLIDTELLRSTLSDPDLRILDCRFDLSDPHAGRRDYRTGHIPGALFADLDRDLSSPVTAVTGRHPLPAVETFTATLGRFGIGESNPVVVYDAGNGAMAARAWWMLRWLGHDDVRLLDGGIGKWSRERKPLNAGEERGIACTFRGRVRNDRILTTREIAGSLDDIGSLRLVDARDAARYRGEIEPIDPIAGHIPGSISLPLTESLNQDETWKSRTELHQLWQRVLGNDTHVPWSVMCGSGVTACHLAISGMEAGFEEPRLYVGSWSEWIRDPQRPIRSETG